MDNETVKADYKLWLFNVKYEPQDGETLCITGDCDSLGQWCPKNIIPLTFNKCTGLWSVCMNIPACEDVHYRYYTCTLEKSGSVQKTMILQWETNFQPRIIKKEDECNDGDDNFDVFGIFDNVQKLENGWVTDDIIVQLRLNSNSIQWSSEYSPQRETRIQLRTSRQGHTSENHRYERNVNSILISVHNESGKFRKQNEDGYSYYDVNSVVFMSRTFSIDDVAFVFEFTDIVENQLPISCYSHLLLENKFHGSNGHAKIPIHSSDHEYLGCLSVKYLIIRPLPDVKFSFKSSYAKYWNNSWTGLEIGHRGAGVSFGNSHKTNARYRENTIGSFKSAGQCGAHLVEFDVQLTSDMVPTIYHDFHVLLEVQNKMDQQKRAMIFPFHQLNYEELKDFNIHHLKEVNGAFSFENDDQEDYSPFPSLEQVLKSVDLQIGFNVEIKYTCELQDGSNELDHPIDMNEYVDKILQVVFANAGRRYIVFSSFSPDVCTMTRFKQNKYPVMFLTQGVTKKYPEYLDARTKNIEAAIKFANSADLLGIVAHSEDLLKDYTLVQMILNSNLVLFCWGEENNSNENIETLKRQGVHGIIFDRIDQLGQKLKKDVFKNGIL